MGFLDKVSDALKEDEDNDSDSEGVTINFSEITNNLKTLEKNKYIYFILLIPILLGAWWIRTRNLGLLANRYLLGLDPYYYLRVASTIVEKGGLPAWDYMRLAPMGWGIRADLFVNILVYWYKFLHAINPAITQIQAHIYFPAAFGVIGFVLFYLMAREFAGDKVALFSTAIFAVIPTYLYRTTAGFADHEAAAMPFLFISIWFFIKLLKAENNKSRLIYSVISGLFAFGMSYTWGAYPMLTIPISIFMIYKVVSENINLNEIKFFTVWNIAFLVPFLIIQTLSGIKNISAILMVFATLLFFIYLFMKKINFEYKYKFKGIASLVILSIIGLAANVVLKIVDVGALIINVLSPAEATGRVAQTISEIIGSTHFWNNFKWPLALAFFGFIIALFLFQKDSKLKYVTTGFGGVLLFIWLFVSITSRTSLILYILFSVFLFALIYFELVESKREVTLLILIVLGMNIYLGSTAARFLFTMSPFIALLAGYCIMQVIEFLWKEKSKELRALSLVVAVVVIYLIVSMGYMSGQSVQYSGSGLAGQWEDAMYWIRDNTEESSIITHWWDYGYWTQTVAQRPSTHDGGTHMENSLQLLGRYAMTGTDDEDVFTYLKTHNVSYLLYSEEEIGKYHAFSYIGSESNQNLDRESTIGMFTLANVEEIRGGEFLTYQGTWVLDQDIVIDRQVIPEGQSAIVSISIIKEGEVIRRPQALIYYNGQRILTNISCMIRGGERIEFETESRLASCITFIPYIVDQTQGNEYGAILFASEKVKDGLFARLYLFNQQVPGFEEVYNDQVPLALYQGRIIGPIKIWKINYPPGTETREDLLI